jgi:hypothetical protein
MLMVSIHSLRFLPTFILIGVSTDMIDFQDQIARYRRPRRDGTNAMHIFAVSSDRSSATHASSLFSDRSSATHASSVFSDRSIATSASSVFSSRIGSRTTGTSLSPRTTGSSSQQGSKLKEAFNRDGI